MSIFNIFKKKPKKPDSIEAAMASQANDFIQAFVGHHAPIDAKQLDFSRESLQLVDQILQDFYVRKVSLPEDLYFLASAYVFECAKRKFGGRYLRGDEDDPFVLVIGEPDCQIGFCAMHKVKGRAKNGPEDSLVFFFDGIAPLYVNKKSATLV